MSQRKSHSHCSTVARQWIHSLFLWWLCSRFYFTKTPKDYDIVTNAHTQDVQKIFHRTIPVGASFGIVRVLEGKDEFEVATFRKDGKYIDGRRPESVEFCDEKEDSMRRDFTINGLFLDPIDNKIIDYVHGQEDIQKRLLRTIGDANERFAEDHLRMMLPFVLRSIRFYN